MPPHDPNFTFLLFFIKRSFSSSDAYDDVDVFVSGSGSPQLVSDGGSNISHRRGDGGSGNGSDGDVSSGGGNEPDLEGHPHQHQGLLDEKEEDLLT